MLKGFKEFIARGNVIDLAVAVVIGAAFSKIVDTIVKGFINPLIGVFLQFGDLDKKSYLVQTPLGSATFAWGSILLAAIQFLVVAIVVYFVFVLPMNVWRKRQAAKEAAGQASTDEPPALTEQELLVQIRDLLAKQQQS